MNNRILYLWERKGGYRELLKIAFPLIISTGIHSIQHFVDRLFLSWHSAEAIAAAMPAGMLNFTLMCIFLGTAGYTNTFVSQYYGSRNYKKIGAVIWNGLFVSLIGGIFILCFIPFAEEIFSIIGHQHAVYVYEVQYFKIVNLGAFPAIAAVSLSGFFSGTNRTMPIMWINLFAMITNIILDYLLIFGNYGFPELGMKGAAIATVIAHSSSFLIYLILINKHEFRDKFNIHFRLKLDTDLFKRFIKYGLPNGIHFFIDIAGFTFFILIVGRLGTISLAATNIAFNLNNIIFLPMIGLGISVTVLTGNYIGAEDTKTAERVTYSGLIITYIYIIPMILSFLIFPHFYINIFSHNSSNSEFGQISSILFILIKFIALYSIFDVLNVIFSATLKGAGDTKFIMMYISLLSITFLIIPTYLLVELFNSNVIFAWIILTFYVSILGIGFYLRFRQGKWKLMSVIEKHKKTSIIISKEESFENI
ncbi:MAG: MATE family efflux transporter [Candidatus Marinimicrobia bacterium]|nr:MATE family efflux transporter [Candidatus Neomarinimicrobiota bacterium]